MIWRLEDLRDGVILHGIVVATGCAFRFVSRRDRRMREALAGRPVTYQFRAGSSARRLVLEGGQARTRGGAGSADLEVVVLDLPGVLRHLAAVPNDMLGLKTTNKIDTAGNLSHLFRFGYLGALVGVYLRRRLGDDTALGRLLRAAHA